MKNTERMLKEWRYLRNRKITKVREGPGEYCVALHFEDGSFCIIGPTLDTANTACIELCSDVKDWNLNFLHTLDLITDEEYATRKAEEDAIWAADVALHEKKKGLGE